jgi:REP element-mobilizing transposase RayT
VSAEDYEALEQILAEGLTRYACRILAYQLTPIQDDDHFLLVCRYVERNALRAGLVSRAEDWRWVR